MRKLRESGHQASVPSQLLGSPFCEHRYRLRSPSGSATRRGCEAHSRWQVTRCKALRTRRGAHSRTPSLREYRSGRRCTIGRRDHEQSPSVSTEGVATLRYGGANHDRSSSHSWCHPRDSQSRVERRKAQRQQNFWRRSLNGSQATYPADRPIRTACRQRCPCLARLLHTRPAAICLHRQAETSLGSGSHR